MVSLEGYGDAFFRASGIALVSELGDKTFFVCALMAISHSRIKVFLAAALALSVMQVFSALLGAAAHQFLAPQYTQTMAAILFIGFGLKSLFDALKGQEEETELQQVEKELISANQSNNSNNSNNSDYDAKSATVQFPIGQVRQRRASAKESKGDESSDDSATQTTQLGGLSWSSIVDPVIAKVFSLCFLAEWGDKSQLSTMGLAASHNQFGVVAGGVVGISLCCAVAVAGGRAIAKAIDEKIMQIIGGLVFLVCGVSASIEAYGTIYSV